MAVLGKGVVGKTSLISRFINCKVPDKHDATIEDRYTTNIKVDDINYEVEVLDTAGEEDFQNMLDMWINFGDGFLLVFAINDKTSFEVLNKKRERIIKTKKDGNGVPPILLVGNKKDLEKSREVTFEEAESLAKSWGIDYIEVSALTNKNCKEAFESIANRIVAKKKIEALRIKKSFCPCSIF